MTNIHTTICSNLINYEKYIPVLTAEEIDSLRESAPTLATLQNWDERLRERNKRLDDVFARAYDKQKHTRL